MLKAPSLDRLIGYLYEDEGYKMFAYDDATGLRVDAPEGNLTIGIGWNIANGIPKNLAEKVARYFIDVADSELTYAKPFYASLDDVRKAVLINMSFNMGTTRLLKFEKMFKAIESKDWHMASLELLNSEAGRKLKNRYTRLSKLMSTGTWI